ncbi:hypothetical protein SAMN05444370_102190 [Rubrimonas cliftonensis]|uniref:Uncharacterized protein n=1 Tax=Rubrimonas cliftonensis TaxID=89524 RepID=A0A1H3WYF9_9RHOB|nr:hypothetical protein SAMN05444370_102190 [Rubrimonas cliftonensis]
MPSDGLEGEMTGPNDKMPPFDDSPIVPREGPKPWY